MKFRWSPASPQPLLAGQLASQLKISPLLAQCLLNRGFSEPSAIQNFLQPRLKNLADPFLLPNMDAAVGRLLRAREQNEPLVIFGDYDVDGVTSTALLLEVLASARLASGFLSAQPDGRRLRLERRRRGKLFEKIPDDVAARGGLRLDGR